MKNKKNISIHRKCQINWQNSTQNFDARPIREKYMCEQFNSMYQILVDSSVYHDFSIVHSICRFLFSNVGIEPIIEIEREKVEITSEKRVTLFNNTTTVKVPLFGIVTSDMRLEATDEALANLSKYLHLLEENGEVTKMRFHPVAGGFSLLKWERKFLSQLHNESVPELLCLSNQLKFTHLENILSAHLGWNLWKPPNVLPSKGEPVESHSYDFWSIVLFGNFNRNLYGDIVNAFVEGVIIFPKVFYIPNKLKKSPFNH